MEVEFRAIGEDRPGKVWAREFDALWPAYQSWWLREGSESRATYMDGLRALKRYMPELVATYERLCELAGGGDRQARFLSMWCPPPYLAGCSQAIWPGAAPLLVRNYDYNPHAFDAIVLRTAWEGRRIIGSSDGMWGLVDGMNDAGLVASLTFGGRRVVGEGFGVPLIMRYVLQTCENVAQAVKALQRIPTHMSYNVTVLDMKRHYATVYLSPDRAARVTHAAVATNHQEQVEWSSHARLTATVERERYLLKRLTLHLEPAERFVAAFLKPPLYSTEFAAGFGTLYTALYRPRDLEMELRWPQTAWRLPLNGKLDGGRRIAYPLAA